MKVIVKESGFYGGTWYDAKPAAIEMPDRIAKLFLPPYGDQLALPAASAGKTVAGDGDRRGGRKAD